MADTPTIEEFLAYQRGETSGLHGRGSDYGYDLGQGNIGDYLADLLFKSGKYGEDLTGEGNKGLQLQHILNTGDDAGGKQYTDLSLDPLSELWSRTNFRDMNADEMRMEPDTVLNIPVRSLFDLEGDVYDQFRYNRRKFNYALPPGTSNNLLGIRSERRINGKRFISQFVGFPSQAQAQQHRSQAQVLRYHRARVLQVALPTTNG